jgi:hypothetical protein
MNYLIKQKDARKIWITVKNILKKCLNTETLNSDRCLKHFSQLCTRKIQGYY